MVLLLPIEVGRLADAGLAADVSHRHAIGALLQRLCSFSGGLPLFFVPEHGVEDGHDLPSDGDEGHHFRLTLSEQALVEGTQHWIAADGGKRRQEDGRTGSWAAAANHALAFPLAGSARERRNPNKACDLAAIETTEAGPPIDAGSVDCVADA